MRVKTARVLRLVLGTLLAAGIAAAFSFRNHFDFGAVDSWLRDVGWVAPFLFVSAYALATVLFLPGSALTLAGGALFGPIWGTLYNLAGATLGATLAFLLARFLVSAR